VDGLIFYIRKRISSLYIKAMQFPVLFINYPYLSNFLFAVIAGMFGACISLVSYSISFINKKSRLACCGNSRDSICCL